MKLEVILFYILLFSSGLVSEDDQWSMKVSEVVTKQIREDAVIPCTYTAPSKVQGKITVIWRITKAFTGAEIFRCVSETNKIECGQNCLKSVGRYSLKCDRKTNNISLKIKNVMLEDEKRYFCRVEMEQGSYENPDGTQLQIQVPQRIENIYIQTLASGEQVVTCDVEGKPLPNVTWIMPSNINVSLVSFRRGFIKASSSISSVMLNTNYVCQIDGENGHQNQSIYFSKETVVQECLISLVLFAVVVSSLTGFFLIIIIIIIIVAMSYRKDSCKTVSSAHQNSFGMMESKGSQEIYANT